MAQAVVGRNATLTSTIMYQLESPLAAYALHSSAPIDANDSRRHSPPIALIVDGDASERDLYYLVMQELGMRTIAAADGWEGLVCARTLLPDLVVTDLHLPGLDGPTLVEQLRADPRTAAIPIMVITTDESSSPSWRVGAAVAAVLIKPLDLRKLAEVVRSALRLGGSGDSVPISS